MTACLALLFAAPEQGELRIGSYSALSGSSAPMGLAQHSGAVLAAEELNAEGGVLGRKVVILDGDDEASAERGQAVVRELIEAKRVHAIIGPANAASANATVELTNRAHVPHIVCASAGAVVNELFERFPQNYVFRLAAGDAIQSKMMVTEAFAVRHKRRPAILADETPYGQNGLARLKKLLADREVTPVYEAKLRIGEQDMVPHVSAARAAGADILLLYTLGGEAAQVARGLEKIGWRAELIGTWTLSFPVFLNHAGPYGEGAIFPQTFIEAGAEEPEQRAFIAHYKKRWSLATIETAPAAAQAYDAVRLLALAFEQAGTTDGDRVRVALENLDQAYRGATGEYYRPWIPDDHEAVTPANVVWGMAKEGRVVLAP